VSAVGADLTPNGLRDTYASLLLQVGTDVYYVSRMLGHASINETVDTYGQGALDIVEAPAAMPAQAKA
jgi:site-specific recombinase XerD